MSKLANQYKKFMKELEANIENKEDFNRIKSEISKLFIIFFNEMDEMKELYESKIDAILERQSDFNDKITKIEGILNNIQKDIYMEDMGDFEVLCPYCNKEFVVQMDELKDEVECPECKNMIELDWDDCGEDEDCLDCSGSCGDCHNHIEFDDEEDEEDDE